MKRRRYIHAVALTVLVALTAACTSDERELANTDFNEPINIAVSSGEITASAVTRGHTSTTAHDGGYTFASTDKVKVGLKRGTAAEELKTYNISSTGALTTTNQFNWSGSSDAVTIRAYSYGYSSDPDDPEVDAPNIGRLEFTLEASQNDYTDDLELLYAPAATFDYATYHSTGVTLNLYHQLSRVVINVKRDKTDDAYDEIGSSTVPNVKIGDGTQTFPHKAYLEVPVLPATQGTWYNPVDDDEQIEPKYWTTPTTGYEHTFSAVLIPGDYSNKKLIYIKTASGEYYYTPTSLTLLPGKQYTFNIGVRNQKIDVTTTISNWETVNSTPTYNIAPDIRRNPLWYVAQYNMAQDKRSFVAAHSTASQYVFTYDDAQDPNIPGYHQPTRDELVSIIPSNVTTGDGTNIFQLLPGSFPYEFSEIACNIGGTSVPASTSVFHKATASDFYAVRFINTPYASAWHYKWVTSPCTGLLIESYLLYDVTTLDKAKEVLNLLSSAGIFTSTAEDASANQTPESTVTTSNSLVQRFIPACGINSSGSGAANNSTGSYMLYRSSTKDGGTNNFIWYCRDGHLFTRSDNNLTQGYSVRLFKDNYTTTGTKAVNTVDNIQAGISDDYAVGDVVCKDGSIFRYNSTDGTAAAQAKAEGRMPIGVIVYKCAATPTLTDMAVTENMGHALVMGIEDISTGDTWAGSTTATGFTDESYGTPELFPNVDLDGTAADYRGLEKTNVLANHLCNASHSHPAFEHVKSWREQAANQLQFTATDWFVASGSQWTQALMAIVASEGHTYTPGTTWTYDTQHTLDVISVISSKAGGFIETSTGRYITSSDNKYYSPNYHYVKISITDANGFHFGNATKVQTDLHLRPFFAF